MKGNAKILQALQKLLRGELTARDQYPTHSRMYENWGLLKLHARLNHEMEKETQHVDALVRHILFLEGLPDLPNPEPMRIGKDAEKMLRNDLELEYEVIERLRDAIALCESEGDFRTREILLTLLRDTEENHAHWLEQQLGLIRKTGLENCLQSQM